MYYNLDPFYDLFIEYARQVHSNELISEYATCYFIREITKGKNHIYTTIEETVN